MAQRVSFTVPASTAYAPELLTLINGNDARNGLLAVTVLIEGVVAACTLELWLLKGGGNPATSTDYFISSNTLSGATAGSVTWPLANWPAAQIRVKGGSTGGNLLVNASAV